MNSYSLVDQSRWGCVDRFMSETIHAVVDQLEAERSQLAQLFDEKQAEAQDVKAKLDRVQAALSALTTTKRATSPSMASATRSELLGFVREIVEHRGGKVDVPDLKEAIKRKLKKAQRSARGLHKTLPHVLAHESFRVDGETVSIRG